MAIEMIPILRTAGLTAEQESIIISSFSEDQKALLETMLTNLIMDKSRISYTMENPTEHVVFAARHDGAINLLHILLGKIALISTEEI